MDKNMTLEKRIDAELYSYQGRMSVFVDDLQGHTVERGADAVSYTHLDVYKRQPLTWSMSWALPRRA